MSSVSTAEMQQIVEKLKLQRHRDPTRVNYYGIWKNFNKFFIKLDKKPIHWEDRIVLYVTFLIQKNRKSATIKSYVSAIKAVLFNGGMRMHEDSTLLSALTKACKINNDRHFYRLPIKKSVIKLLISALDKLYAKQPYLAVMYKALILSTCFRLLRIGEVTKSPHVIKATDVQIGTNKPKLRFILRSSKTHNKGDELQIVKISGSSFQSNDPICPFKAVEDYLAIRKPYNNTEEQFFVFSDRSPVTPEHYRHLVKKLMKMNKLDFTRYGVHGMRSGRSVDLLEMGVSVETIRKLGRWKSTAVYTYLRNM